MRVVGMLLGVCVGLAAPAAASAEESFAASMRLRGGYDSNPEFSVAGVACGLE